MPKYECRLCNYTTKNKSDLTKHIKTKKHLEILAKNNNENSWSISAPENSSKLLKTPENSSKLLKTPENSSKLLKTPENSSELLKTPVNSSNKKLFECESCGNFFVRANNLTRHYKVCTKNNAELTLLKTQNEKYKDENEHYKEEAIYYKQMLMEAGGLVKKSVSALTYSITNFDNAPHIKTIKIDDVKTFKSSNKKIVEDILSYYKHKTLNKHLGNIILDLYKKENPLDQSIWNTDDTRLTYLIKELLNDQASNWIVDKKGAKTAEYVIDPLLKYIKELIISYQKNYTIPEIGQNSIEIEMILENSKKIIEVVNGIDDGVIAKEVLKYISIHLRFNDKSLKLK